MKYKVANCVPVENTSTEKSSTGGGIIKYGKIKYDCAGMENSSTEKASTNVQRWKVQVQKNEVRVSWDASTNSAGKVKHNNSPIILRSGKQLSPFCLNLCNF